MPIPISCPSCQRRLQAKDEQAGRTLKCPACGTGVAIPEAASSDDLYLERARPRAFGAWGQGDEDMASVDALSTPITALVNGLLGKLRFFRNPSRFEGAQRLAAMFSAWMPLASAAFCALLVMYHVVKSDLTIRQSLYVALGLALLGCLGIAGHYVVCRFALAGARLVRSESHTIPSTNILDTCGVMLIVGGFLYVGLCFFTGRMLADNLMRDMSTLTRVALFLDVVCAWGLFVAAGLMLLNPGVCLNIRPDPDRKSTVDAFLGLVITFPRLLIQISPFIILSLGVMSIAYLLFGMEQLQAGAMGNVTMYGGRGESIFMSLSGITMSLAATAGMVLWPALCYLFYLAFEFVLCFLKTIYEYFRRAPQAE